MGRGVRELGPHFQRILEADGCGADCRKDAHGTVHSGMSPGRGTGYWMGIGVEGKLPPHVSFVLLKNLFF